MTFAFAEKRYSSFGSHTWLEAVHRSNVAGGKLVTKDFFVELRQSFQVRKPSVRSKSTASGSPKDDLIDSTGALALIAFSRSPPKEMGIPLFLGTMAVIGASGKPIGKHVESECRFGGAKKTVIVKLDDEHAHLKDTLLTRDHGFAPDGTPLLPLSKITGEPIRNDEDMASVNELFLDLRGSLARIAIPSRDAILSSPFGDDILNANICSSAAAGLILVGAPVAFYTDGTIFTAYLNREPSRKFPLVAEAPNNDLLVLTRDGKFVAEFEGPQAKVDSLIALARANGLLP
ncbi:MAG: hypothetical protein WCT31_01910 [Candidatus Micrarchaeia archaeon]|jgi:hypothetical protein